MFELNKIERIIFIKDKKRVCIFYSDGTLKYVSVDEGKTALSSLARKEGLEKENIKNWNKVEFCSFKEFGNKYENEIYMRENKTRFEFNKKIEEDRRKEKRRIKDAKVREKQSTGRGYAAVSLLVSAGFSKCFSYWWRSLFHIQ